MVGTAEARPIEAWVDDLMWHRRMFQQSRFRWLPEDALQIALRATRGSVDFTTARHLTRLDQDLMALQEFTEQIQRARADELRHARAVLAPRDWAEALRYLAMSPDEAAFLLWITTDLPPVSNDQTRRVTRGIPWATPLSRAWELHQLWALWDAACAILEDCVCDLVEELAERRGYSGVVGLTRDFKLIDLQARVEINRERRGGPGDPRRTRRQTYPTPVPH